MAESRNRSSRYLDISCPLCSIQTMIIALPPRPCLRLSTDSVPAPLQPLFWLLRNVISLLPSAIFRDFWAQPLHHDGKTEAKHQARAPGRPILKGASRKNKKFTVTFGRIQAYFGRTRTQKSARDRCGGLCKGASNQQFKGHHQRMRPNGCEAGRTSCFDLMIARRSLSCHPTRQSA
jgi:hypothetical protein